MSSLESSFTREYSKRLGTLTGDQLQAALDRFHLGPLLSAEPARGGLFGQNVLLTSTRGDWVLRGAPHHEWQLPKERFFAHHIHERTKVPAPWPYWIEFSEEIFGWSYAVMPQFPNDPVPEDDPAAQSEVADALGASLANLHALTWKHVGEYDGEADDILPREVPHREWIESKVHKWVGQAQKASDATTDDDVAWIEDVLRENGPALDEPFTPTYVHHDFRRDNAGVRRVGEEWEVTGVFDLMEGYFGDREEDLVRSINQYLPEKPHCVAAFLAAYSEGRPLRDGYRERYRIYMLTDCIGLWNYGQQNRLWFPPHMRFRDYAEQFVSFGLP